MDYIIANSHVSFITGNPPYRTALPLYEKVREEADGTPVYGTNPNPDLQKHFPPEVIAEFFKAKEGA